MQGIDLKKIRTDLGLNQTQFGIELGFTPKGAQRSVHALESGERPIKDTIAKLAQILHASAPTPPEDLEPEDE